MIGSAGKSPVYCIGFNLWGEVILDTTNLRHDIYFDYAVFGGPLLFLKCDFEKNISFFASKFCSETDFVQVSFEGAANFTNALFKGITCFFRVSFEGAANFTNALFVDHAKFIQTNFEAESNFTRANFYRKSKFMGTNFKVITRFRDSTFRDHVQFLHGNFEELSDFSNTWFEDGAYFNHINFGKLADFSSTRDIYHEYGQPLKKLANKADLLIIIKRSGQQYDVMLDSEETSYAKVGDFKLEGDPEQDFRRIFKDLQDHRKNINETIERNGEYLYDILFPDGLKNKYWKLRDNIKSIQVLSDEPWIPWEILRPYRKLDNGKVETDSFLCEKFSFSRWINGQPRQIKDHLEQVKIFMPTDTNLKFVSEERKWIEDKGNEIGFNVYPDSTEEALKETLTTGKYDLIHFSTHAYLDGDPLYSVLELEKGGKVRPIDISAEQSVFGAAHPIVFMNACVSGVQQIFLTGAQGWVMKMLAAGVSAFIGTLWSVKDLTALEFTKAFYGSLTEGHSLGEAMMTARNHCKNLPSTTDASWLAYVLYGEPNAKLTIGGR
jgi:hypothetical protein